jgi:hypothetical protein
MKLKRDHIHKLQFARSAAIAAVRAFQSLPYSMPRNTPQTFSHIDLHCAENIARQSREKCSCTGTNNCFGQGEKQFTIQPFMLASVNYSARYSDVLMLI